MSLCKYDVSHCGLCPEGIHELGRCLLDKGKPDEAENLLRESLDMTQTACPDDKASIAISKSLFCLTVTRDLISGTSVLIEQLLQCVSV